MREEQIAPVEGDDDGIEEMAPYFGVDWKAQPREVLEAVDAMLIANGCGLEVITVNRGDDMEWFRIGKARTLRK